MSDPIDAIDAMLKSKGWPRRMVLPAFGGLTSRMSEVMNRKRPLSLGMIRCLVFNYGMSAETMVQWYPTEQQPEEPVSLFDMLTEAKPRPVTLKVVG